METTAVVTKMEFTKKVKDPTEVAVAVVAEVVVVLEIARTKTMKTQRTP